MGLSVPHASLCQILKGFPKDSQDKPLLTRFAPAPTGLLHPGHILSALYVWGVADVLGARVLLRIEDHDSGRSRPEYERAILEDLAWLGFIPDQLLTRQSDHPERYTSALEGLQAKGHHIYHCACSRRSIRAAMPPGTNPGAGLRYGGTCRHKGLTGDGTGLRIVLQEQQMAFADLLLGEQQQIPARQCGDLLIRERSGDWTYQFAVTIDDAVDGINLVVRGQDLTASTGRQLQLAAMAGYSRPIHWLHHPLMMDGQGHKLSKSTRAESIAGRREQGEDPAALLGSIAREAGLWSGTGPLPAARAGDLFRS